MNHYPLSNIAYGTAYVGTWWFRWHKSARPGCYIISTLYSPNRDAVMDDYGNLVDV
jgi:hypothetical protein